MKSFKNIDEWCRKYRIATGIVPVTVYGVVEDIALHKSVQYVVLDAVTFVVVCYAILYIVFYIKDAIVMHFGREK